MPDDRTQPPSRRRRQVARQQGQVAHSPELTAAAGWLVALATLAAFGGDLVAHLTALVRGSLALPPVISADPVVAVSRVREQVLGVAWPLLAIVAGFSVGALAAHQCQVRGLWATQLIVPEPTRLWGFSRRQGFGAQIERSVWSVIKATVVVTASLWLVSGGWNGVAQLGTLEAPVLAQAIGWMLLRTAWVLGGVFLVLGLFDYALRFRRFEAMLRTTPEEQREDQRITEGDAAARAQRFRVARSWRGHSPELLSGACLVLTGPAGLTLVLEGGPPPRRVHVRTTANGMAGMTIRRSAETKNLPMVEAPDLARRLARRPTAGSPIATEVVAELASIWPVA